MSVASSSPSRGTAWWAAPVVAALIAIAPPAGVAQIGELRLPISLDADATDYDGKSSMLMFTGLRLSQGTMGVVADEGRATKLDFEDSVWRFDGNVVIDIENGRIRCDSADLTFREHQLVLAVIEGRPATFEMTRPGSDEATYAEARKLRYDLATATVEFSGEALINEGGNEIASEFLAYNILERRIKAVSSGDAEDKVRIRYTPPPAGDETAGSADEDEGPDDEAEDDPDGEPEDDPDDGEDPDDGDGKR